MQANNQEQEQENNCGIEPERAWETTRDSYPESVALLRSAFQKKNIENEESERNRATIKDHWYEWNYDSEKQARATWKRENVLKDEVDFPHFLDKLRQFLFEPTSAWQSR